MRRAYLFIHGAGGSKNKWRAIAPFLETKPRDYYFIDLPGHGENQSQPAQSIEDYASKLNEAFKNRNLIVIGHSMGGLIALEMAKQNPRVKGIILIASHFQLPVHPKIIGSLQEGSFPESLFRASYGPNAEEALLKEEQNELLLNPIHIITSDFIQCSAYQKGEKTLSQLKTPILAIYGKEDRLLPPYALEKLEELVPYLEKKIIEGAGHYILLEKPKEVAREILNFRIKQKKRATKERKLAQ